VIIGIVVQAEDIQTVFTAAQFAVDAARQHIPGFELRLVLRVGVGFAVEVVRIAGDLHQRIGQHEARLRIDVADGVDRRQRRAHQLAL